ncbi:MAG: sugar phosphate isomerase/epimerase [Planctomycetes bacterium]|jgi:sugar phosphate isomerase/epimerase|nr:sugar phosphate isomerase/epimerase [Planctomycetota bacterium]MCL4730661.1 sugar phosphate isomerase/epimerase [Planctomycetota bacterium]
MKLGYNTNGFGFHRLEDAIAIIAETGYSVVALTLDVHHLNPFEASAAEVNEIARLLHRHKLECVIETGARFLLDPRRKHRPTLIDDEPDTRVHFMHRAAEIAGDLGALALSYWSGARPEQGGHGDDELFRRLAFQADKLEQLARRHGTLAALEPEPGMLVESMADYDRLAALMGYRPGLTLDIGHLQCVEDEPPSVYPCKYRDVLYNLQLDDMRRGAHQHLFFGEGDIDFAAVFAALKQIGYEGPACVELSDASRNAVETARRAKQFLDRSLNGQP